MKRILSISLLILPLLALVFAQGLSAQTVVVDKPTLTFSGQVGGTAVPQTVNVTSSTGASIPFAFSVPQGYSWLKVGGQSIISANTPATITITADPTGLAAGTYPATPPAYITVSGGANNNTPIAVTFNVSTIGVTPQTLTFSYTLGTNNYPAPQNLSLSSTAGMQCTATAATTGGNWILPLQNPCVSPGTLTVQLNNSVVAGLAANSYTGTITITPPAGQGPPAVVSVTLTVLPTPPVTVNPQALILNYQTGVGAANPSQAFTITTTTGQQLGFSFIQSGSLSSISSISPPSGTTNPATGTAQVSYTVNPTGLAVGTYTGKITLFTFGGSPPQQDIGVTLNVSATALLNVPSATLNFTGQLGNTPAAQAVNISATSGLLNYSVYTSNYNPSGIPTWLVVPNAGSTATPLTVSVNPTGLAAGTYSATINVVSATVGSTAQQIPVVLKVSNDPTISASVSTLSFPYQIGQTTPATQSFRITSSTGVPLNYATTVATTTCGSVWLQAANANNSLAGVTDDTLTVSVAPTGLAAGTCSGTLTINATNPATGGAAVNSPITIGVTLFVSSNAQLVLTPANLQPFTVGVGAQSPAPQAITLSSTSTDVLTYSVSFQSTGNWLSVNTLTGTTAAPNNSLTIFAFTNGLAAGVYAGSVTVTATGPGGAIADSPVVIPVTLNVSAGTLTLSATDLTFPAQSPGGAAPSPQMVTIGSSGQPLNYTAIANSNRPVTWLSVSPTNGNTTSSGVITVAVDGSKLPAGTYTGTIVVSSPGAGNVTINVHFTVNPGTLSAPNTTLTFTQAVGGASPPAQTIAVTASPVALTFTTVSTTTNGVNWLSATPATGTTPSSVQVSVSGAGLAQGQYTGTVTIASTGATGSPIAVGVILNVVQAAVLAVSPTELSFAYNIGQTLPAPQNLAVTATNSVPITAQVQQDGTAGSWLAVTPTSGTAPATLAVSVGSGATSLAAGKYTGHIVISSPNSLGPVSVTVTLNVTTIPQPVVSSVANAANYSTGSVSPGENIAIFGSGVGPATLVNGIVVNNAFTTVAGNTRVLFDNVAAPVIYASNGQTSVMVPYGVAGRTTTSIVVEYSGVQSAPLTYNVAAAVPGVYTQNSQGTGPGAILNQDGLTVNGANAPEKRGNVIAIYMTGEGQTTPQGVDGAIIPAVASALKKPNLGVTVTVGGIDAPVQYAGSAPGLVSGVMQVNVIIPLTVATGTQPVVVTVGTAKSQSGASAATVAVQ